MGFLRGLGTTICSILLFLGLSVFSVAFMANSTVLNTDFINDQIDKLDITSMARETIEEFITDALPTNSDLLQGTAMNIIEELEPQIKALMHTAINEGYNYFLDKSSTLSITIPLADIKASLKDNIWQMAVEYLKIHLAEMSPADADKYVSIIASEVPADALTSELAALPSNVRQDILEQYLDDLGGRSSFDPLSFGLNFAVEQQAKAAFEQYYDEAIAGIPDNYNLDEGTVDADVLNAVRSVRDAVAIFKAAYIWLIVFIIVMAGLIFLINWKNVRASLRTLGIDLLIFGVIDLAGTLIVRGIHFEKYFTNSVDIPVSVQNWIQGLTADLTGIMLIFSISVLVIGVALTTVSFFIKSPEVNA